MMKRPMEQDSRWDMLLFDYVEGNLSPEEAAEVERMMAESPAIRQEVEAWRQAKMPAPPPVEYPYVQSLKKETESKRGGWMWWRIAAVLIVGVFIGVLGMRVWQLFQPQKQQIKVTAEQPVTPPASGKEERVVPTEPTKPALADRKTLPSSVPPVNHVPKKHLRQRHHNPMLAQASGLNMLEPLEKLPLREVEAPSWNSREQRPAAVLAYFPVAPLPVKDNAGNSECPPQLMVSEYSRGAYQGYEANLQIGCRSFEARAEVMKPRYWLPYALTKVNQAVVNTLFASSE